MAALHDLTTISSNFDTNNFSFSHTCTGTQLLLIVSVHLHDNVNVSAATYNSVSMTEIPTDSPQTHPDGGRIQMFYLVAPATGSNTVALTHNTAEGRAVASSYTQMAQSSPLDASAGGSNGSGDPSTDITTTVANCLLYDAGVWGDESVAGAPNEGRTERYDAIAGSGIAQRGFASEDLDSGATGTKTMSWTHADSLSWAQICVAFVTGSVTITPAVQSVTVSIPAVTVTAYPIITYEIKDTLPTNDTDLANELGDHANIRSDDASRESFPTAAGASKYMIWQVRMKNSNSTDKPKFTWNGQSTIATSSQTCFLQLYNQNTPAWETHDSDLGTGADTDFGMTHEQSANIANYYNGSDEVVWRIYQQVPA